MNCDVLQRHLLGSESPDRPSAAASAHLADCAACREWLQRLLQMESALPYLPVPPAEAARSALMRRILTEQAANGEATGDKPQPTKERRRPSIALVLGSWIMDPRASPRRRVAAGLIAGVAAALLLFVTGGLVWLAVHTPPPDDGLPPKVPVDSLAQELRRYKIDPGDSEKPRDRVNAMAAAAEVLSGRAAGQRRPDEELIAMAQLYSRVVEEGVLRSADGLSAEERREILEPVCKSLEKSQSEWAGMASQQVGLSPQVKEALQKAALAAETGNKRLRQLYTA
jgi:hypothetical protein